MSDKVIILIAILKGMTMATIIVVIADATFIQGLVTAIASAIVSGTFLLVSVHLTSKVTNRKVEESKNEIIESKKEET